MSVNTYQVIVGVCFGSSYADARQSVYVTFSSSCKTLQGFRSAVLKAARKVYPRYARLFSSDDCSIVRLMPLADMPCVRYLPKGVYTFNGHGLYEGWF